MGSELLHPCNILEVLRKVYGITFEKRKDAATNPRNQNNTANVYDRNMPIGNRLQSIAGYGGNTNQILAKFVSFLMNNAPT